LKANFKKQNYILHDSFFFKSEIYKKQNPFINKGWGKNKELKAKKLLSFHFISTQHQSKLLRLNFYFSGPELDFGKSSSVENKDKDLYPNPHPDPPSISQQSRQKYPHFGRHYSNIHYTVGCKICFIHFMGRQRLNFKNHCLRVLLKHNLINRVWHSYTAYQGLWPS